MFEYNFIIAKHPKSAWWTRCIYNFRTVRKTGKEYRRDRRRDETESKTFMAEADLGMLIMFDRNYGIHRKGPQQAEKKWECWTLQQCDIFRRVGPLYDLSRHGKVYLVQHDVLCLVWGLCTPYCEILNSLRFLLISSTVFFSHINVGTFTCEPHAHFHQGGCNPF